MEKKVVILPIDGYENAKMLLDVTRKLISEEGMDDLIAYIKVNDGIHNMDMGAPAIVASLKALLAEKGITAGIFLDLKIFDVSATMVNVLKKYLSFAPDIVTVSASCSVAGIKKLREILPSTTKLAMVSVLTDISEAECLTRFGMSPGLKIFSDLFGIRTIYKELMVDEASESVEPFDFVVCSPKELPFLKANLLDYGFIVPGIRDEWMKNPNEHQKRTTGARRALEDGATFLVMGSQLTKGNPSLSISAKESRELTKKEISFLYK